MNDAQYRWVEAHVVPILLTFSAICFCIGTLLRSWSARVDRAVTWGGGQR